MQMTLINVVLPVVFLLIGGGIGWFVRNQFARARIEKARSESQEIVNRNLQEIEHNKRQAVLKAREEWLKSKSRLEQDLQARLREGEKQKRALDEREAVLTDRDSRQKSRERGLEQREREATQSSGRSPGSPSSA
jgi:hypothetical protein